ncbi:MAG: ACGX-repeat peptide [Ruminococcus sp.]|nr:ACGX-repeat peptide [Ruminococcus sp.]
MALSNLYGWNDEKETQAAAACGTACGASDKPAEAPSACGSACGASDK